MGEKDIEYFMELVKQRLEEAKQMTKTQSIRSLNDAGILNTKGEFKKNYQPLQEIVTHA